MIALVTAAVLDVLSSLEEINTASRRQLYIWREVLFNSLQERTSEVVCFYFNWAAPHIHGLAQGLC